MNDRHGISTFSQSDRSGDKSLRVWNNPCFCIVCDAFVRSSID